MQRLDMICFLFFFSKLIVGVILGSHASLIYRGDGSCAWFSMDTQESQASCFIESLLWSIYMLSVGQDPHFMAPWGLGHPSYVYKTASKTIPPGLVPASSNWIQMYWILLNLTGHACILMNGVVPRLIRIISRCFVGLQIVPWEIDCFNQLGTWAS